MYQGPETNTEVCNFHPGVPIFHEGLKFWSCCQKRTTEFEVFMQQKGCKEGTHNWIKPKDPTNQSGGKIVKCRHDWHQDGSQVHLVIYAKRFDPSRSEVKANGVKLSVELYFPEEQGHFQEEWILAGVNLHLVHPLESRFKLFLFALKSQIIVPEKTSVLMTPMKLEIKLKKAEPVSWKDLALPKGLPITKTEEAPKNDYSTGVDPLDLSDL